MFIPMTIDDINLLIAQKIEEGVQLDFKRQLPDSGKNDDLTKALCAMANSEGGVIVYGIIEDELGRANSLNPFPLKDAAERVAVVASTLIDEPIALDSTMTIEQSNQEGFLVVVIPKSERAPHFVRGTAYGRLPKATTTLTRRQIGVLFSRSPGFAEEFGLITGKPGRALAKIETEQHPKTDSRGQLKTERRYFLVFENDGESDIFNVDWEWVLEEDETLAPPSVMDNPLPLDIMVPGVRVRALLPLHLGVARNVKVKTRWKDRAGISHKQTWPISW